MWSHAKGRHHKGHPESALERQHIAAAERGKRHPHKGSHHHHHRGGHHRTGRRRHELGGTHRSHVI